MRTFLLLAALAGAACASAQRAPAADDDATARTAEERSSALERQLSALFTGAAPADCARICPLAGEICALSERICSLAHRHGDDLDLGARCVAGRQRCERSRKAAGRACICPQ
jgi:hypothetical protein